MAILNQKAIKAIESILAKGDRAMIERDGQAITIRRIRRETVEKTVIGTTTETNE